MEADPNWRESLITLVKEIYEGPPNPQGTWIVENEANSGIFGTIARLTAEQASTPPGCGRNTVAAHTNHLLFGLQSANATTRGDEPSSDWEGSWTRQQVTDDEWQSLQKDLRKEYEHSVESFRSASVPDSDAMTGCIAFAAHAAYHLGAIRQQVIR